MIQSKNFNINSFIGGWYIDKELCDEIIDYFNFNTKYSYQGVMGSERLVEKETKESVDLLIGYQNIDNVIGEYRKSLQQCLEEYIKKYEFSANTERFTILEDYNLQKYPIGGGYKKFHHENTGVDPFIYRHLVFMTYLNDVEDGGTEFLYQDIKTKAEKGLTLIWPAVWTHTHRGITSHTKEKFITTGWYSFIR